MSERDKCLMAFLECEVHKKAKLKQILVDKKILLSSNFLHLWLCTSKTEYKNNEKNQANIGCFSERSPVLISANY